MLVHKKNKAQPFVKGPAEKALFTPKKVAENTTFALATFVSIGIQEITGECPKVKAEAFKDAVSAVAHLVPALGANDIGCRKNVC